MKEKKEKVKQKEAKKTKNKISGRTVATYVVVGVITFTMVFSIFATLISALY